MLIGESFNKICEKILLLAGDMSELEPGRKISVLRLSEELNLERNEIRNTFEYLIDLKLIKIESIGGPVLYGHISLTGKGIQKLKSIQKRSRLSG